MVACLILFIAAGPIYINEVTAANVRGKVMSFWQMFFSVGAFFAYWVNYACSKNKARLGNWDWKIVSICNNAPQGANLSGQALKY